MPYERTAVKTTRRLGLLVWLIAAAVLLLAVEGVIFFVNLRAERRAAELLLAVGSLRIRESTDADVEQIVNRFGGEAGLEATGVCPSNSTHSVEIRSEGLNWLGLNSAWLRPFGNRIWSVSALIATSQGRVCWISLWANAVLWDIPQQLQAETDAVLDDSVGEAHHVSTGTRRNISFIRIQISPNATSQQMQSAADFDLSCLTRIGGCRATCELLPSAWVDYQIEARKEGWSLPNDELNDNRCKTPSLDGR